MDDSLDFFGSVELEKIVKFSNVMQKQNSGTAGDCFKNIARMPENTTQRLTTTL